jgi:hypothetical protein
MKQEPSNQTASAPAVASSALFGLLCRLEWSGYDPGTDGYNPSHCPICQRFQPGHQYSSNVYAHLLGHAPECDLAKAIKQLAPNEKLRDGEKENGEKQ